jgi:hypothetical protein
VSGAIFWVLNQTAPENNQQEVTLKERILSSPVDGYGKWTRRKIRANSLALAWSVTVLGVGAIQRGNLREQLLVFGALKLQSQLVHTPLD